MSPINILSYKWILKFSEDWRHSHFFPKIFSNTVIIYSAVYIIDTYLVEKISVCQTAALQTKFVWRCKKGIEWGYSDVMNCNTPALSIYITSGLKHGWGKKKQQIKATIDLSKGPPNCQKLKKKILKLWWFGPAL